jgi:hypothetical protein
MHLITRHAKLHTQIVSFLFTNDVDFISNNYVYKTKHLCIGTICLSKSEKMRIMKNDYSLPNTKREMNRGSILKIREF